MRRRNASLQLPSYHHSIKASSSLLTLLLPLLNSSDPRRVPYPSCADSLAYPTSKRDAFILSLSDYQWPLAHVPTPCYSDSTPSFAQSPQLLCAHISIWPTSVLTAGYRNSSGSQVMFIHILKEVNNALTLTPTVTTCTAMPVSQGYPQTYFIDL